MSEDNVMIGNPQRLAIVELADTKLRSEVQHILTQLRLPAGQSSAGPLAIFRDGPGPVDAEGKRVVRFWSNARRVGAARPKGNPFRESGVLSWVGTEPTVDPLVVGSTLKHLSTRQFLSLAELMHPAATVSSVEVRSSKDKHLHAARLGEFFVHHGVSGHVRRALVAGLDELFTNAIYNAPVDGAGKHLFAATDRSRPVESPRTVRVRFAIDDKQCAVAVRDQYGSLNPDVVRRNLERCFEGSRATIDDKDGGAGLGFFMLLQESTRLVVNIGENNFTEVIMIRRLHERRRDFLRTSPTLNLCFEGGKGGRTGRRFHRVHSKLKALLVDEGLAGQILDISRGGAFVVFESPGARLTQGQQVKILLSNAGGIELRVAGRVRWSGMSNEHFRPGCGIAFDEPLPEGALKSLGLAER